MLYLIFKVKETRISRRDNLTRQKGMIKNMATIRQKYFSTHSNRYKNVVRAFYRMTTEKSFLLSELFVCKKKINSYLLWFFHN